jgi:hypothetical protein
MNEGWPLLLRELRPGVWLYKTEWGNYGIKEGNGYTTCGSLEDALDYVARSLGSTSINTSLSLSVRTTQ